MPQWEQLCGTEHRGPGLQHSELSGRYVNGSNGLILPFTYTTHNNADSVQAKKIDAHDISRAQRTLSNLLILHTIQNSAALLVDKWTYGNCSFLAHRHAGTMLLVAKSINCSQISSLFLVLKLCGSYLTSFSSCGCN